MVPIWQNPAPDAIRELLARCRTVAVVGLSDKPHRDSHEVAAVLLARGYQVIPVNPNVESVLGRRAYPSLREVPCSVDIVDVFRRPEFVPAVVEDAIVFGAQAIWLQEGVVHPAAALRAQAVGLTVVMDRCIARDLARFRVFAPSR
jgi:predicted CoA-binding protein